MSVNTKAASVPHIEHFAEDNQISEPKQFVQYSLLAEIPGLIFGLLTLVYVVSSLWLLG
ncbi:MAG: hypothetical protein JO121_30155 [Deltaproteobacteria bacterium]|jgi:hypothetical protein|nr:hypothetical protein [Deltaproteobacteria bacterium]